MHDADPPVHEGRIDLEEPANEAAPEGTPALTARHVRYPGCQQLQLWLPRDMPGGYGAWRLVGEDGSITLQGLVRDKLNGSVQMLFDTLAWPPGRWRLEIDHDAGWRHVLTMRKHHRDAAPEPPVAPPASAAAEGGAGRDGSPIVYRDGYGRVVPDLDLEMRAAVFAQVAARFARRVSYDGYGRAGTYTWTDGTVRIRFDQEMGAGPCRALILVPSPARWAAATGLPLSRRDEVLSDVARQAQQDFGSRHEIGIDSIAVY